MIANVDQCASTGTAADFLPARLTLPNLKRAVRKCRGCPLYCNATQAVFGEGARHPRLMLIGEQPGDQEDLQGHPFVGPAGRMLDQCLEAAGIARTDIYLTNAVKHFKWEPRGKRRIHAKPAAREIKSCKPWLEAEIALLQPSTIVCLGATAAQCLLGPKFRLTQHRGEFQTTPYADRLLATVHPSALLRIPLHTERDAAIKAFIADLKQAHR